jgi:hypothetical protein
MSVEIKHYFNGELIVKEGATADRFYLVKVGSVVLLETGRPVVKVTPGEMLCAEYAISRGAVPFTALSHGATSLIEFERSVLDEKVGGASSALRNMVTMVLSLARGR